jgi:hypothetical protein
VGFSIGAVALKAGGTPQVIAYVTAWALFASSGCCCGKSRSCRQGSSGFAPRVSLPFPFLAAAISMAIGRPSVAAVDSRYVII